ncbi:MAG TPA: ABC transporter permease [Flavobacterium sp.]|jgi:predicted hotdog family 3-hydroxylacyl-ACP dehydratase
MAEPIDIKNYLPHRAPMLMVDWILVLDNQQVETIFTIKSDNIFVENGIFCESGLIENAAQTCSSIVGKGYCVDENNQDREGVAVMGFISALKVLKIHSLPSVGSTINSKSVLISKFATDDYTLCTMSCSTFNGDELLLEGEINLFIQEIPQAEAETENI